MVPLLSLTILLSSSDTQRKRQHKFKILLAAATAFVVACDVEHCEAFAVSDSHKVRAIIAEADTVVIEHTTSMLYEGKRLK